MKKYNIEIKFLAILLVFFLLINRLTAQDLGADAYSTLRWNHFSISQLSNGNQGVVIGLTADKKMYVAGQNTNFIINAKSYNNSSTARPQFTFKYIPSPAGETVKKVDVMTVMDDISGTSYGVAVSSFGCLTESGKLYVWGFNNGLLTNAFPVSTVVSTYDTTKVARLPVQLSIPGETSIVDFDMPNNQAVAFGSRPNYWAVVGASGKAYVIGKLSGTGGSIFPADDATNFYAIQNPAGVATTFKYVKVWASDNRTCLFLKGNDGNIYYAGDNTSERYNNTGVPSLFLYRDATGFTYSNDGVKLTGLPTTYSFRTSSPFLVPFPTGEDIIKIDTRLLSNTLALSASGKAYATGVWKYQVLTSAGNYYRFPLKNIPTLGTELHKYVVPSTSDTTYVLKKFVEVAVPTGANKIVEFSSLLSREAYETFLIVGDNKKTYWSGTTAGGGTALFSKGNYFDYTTDCMGTDYKTLYPYTWEVPAPLYSNLSKIVVGNQGAYLISSSNVGYVAGIFRFGSGAFGRTGDVSQSGNNDNVFIAPTPIGNELLDACNTSPGTGGSVSTPTVNAVGVLDCSKTQLIAAPVVGTVSNLSLAVTINVTTAGTFTPITVSGSGMSVALGYTINTTTTGVQQFVIPVHYDGTALGTLNFTVGSAGTCSADLAGTSKKTVNMDVWTLDNCTLKLAAPKLK